MSKNAYRIMIIKILVLSKNLKFSNKKHKYGVVI